MTPREFGFVATGPGWNIPAASVGLEHVAGGYGLLLVDHSSKGHMTLAGDPDYTRMLRDGGDADVLANLEIPAGQYRWARQGWPDEWQRPEDSSEWAGVDQQTI